MTSERIIAGHHFEDTPNGCRCTRQTSDGTGLCYRSWLDIRGASADDVGKPDIAHVGSLNDLELKEIIVEREREELAVWEAVSYAASSGSR